MADLSVEIRRRCSHKIMISAENRTTASRESESCVLKMDTILGDDESLKLTSEELTKPAKETFL